MMSLNVDVDLLWINIEVVRVNIVKRLNIMIGELVKKENLVI